MKNKWLYWCGLVILVFFCLPVTAWAVDNNRGSGLFPFRINSHHDSKSGYHHSNLRFLWL